MMDEGPLRQLSGMEEPLMAEAVEELCFGAIVRV